MEIKKEETRFRWTSGEFQVWEAVERTKTLCCGCCSEGAGVWEIWSPYPSAPSFEIGTKAEAEALCQYLNEVLDPLVLAQAR